MRKYSNDIFGGLLLRFILVHFILVSYTNEISAHHVANKIENNIEIDARGMQPGSTLLLNWSSVPIMIYRRSNEEVARLSSSKVPAYSSVDAHKFKQLVEVVALHYGNNSANLLLLDHLDMDRTLLRSKDKRYLVLIGFSPSSGCSFRYKSKLRMNNYGQKILSGLLDPCTKDVYDLSGRITTLNGKYVNQARKNRWDLMIPSYEVSKQGVIKIGIGHRKNLTKFVDLRKKIDFNRLSKAQRFIQGIKYGKLSEVKRAVVNGVDINSHDGSIATSPLVLSIGIKHLAISEFLLTNGASIKNKLNKRSALCTAIYSRQVKAIDLLGKHKASFKPGAGQAGGCFGPLIIEAISSASSETEAIMMVTMLMAYGAQPAEVDKFGKSAVFYANNKKFTILKKILLTKRRSGSDQLK